MTQQDQALLGEAAQGTLTFAAAPWAAAKGVVDDQGWDELALSASMPNPFFERWALVPALEQFAADHTVLLAQLFDGDQLVGVMPVSMGRDYYGHPIPHVSTWLHHNAFCGTPLVATGYELAFWAHLISWADRASAMSPFLHLPKLPTDGPVHAALREALSLGARPTAIAECEERALLASELGSEEYYTQSMTRKRRKELRRLHTRLAEQGDLQLVRQRGTAGLAEWIDASLFLEKAGWKGKQGTSLADHSSTTQFFREALTGAAETNRLERLSFTLDGRPIAMLANFVTPPGVFSFKTTFDEDFARYSPGLLLQIDNLALLDTDGINWADSCAAADHPMIERIWREKREIVSVNVALGGSLRKTAMKVLARLETGSFPKGI